MRPREEAAGASVVCRLSPVLQAIGGSWQDRAAQGLHPRSTRWPMRHDQDAIVFWRIRISTGTITARRVGDFPTAAVGYSGHRR